MTHSATAIPAAPPPTKSFLKNRTVRRFFKRPPAVIAFCILVTFILVAIFAPLIAPFDPITPNFRSVRSAPSMINWLGTDELGRDVLSRVIWGARSSLLAAIIPVTIALCVSVPLGLLAGYMRGIIDLVLMRLTDAMLAIPFLIIAIALAAFLGPSLFNAMIAIGVAALPTFIRLSRATVLSIVAEDYIEAARAVGNSSFRIAWRHVIPNIVPPLLIQASLTIAAAIVAEASLSFLGLGQQPPSPSWGSMLNAAQRYLPVAPWMAIFPGVVIFVLVMALNLLGDGLRDALETKRS
jgi:peptide/nickel transport system permease protein